MQVILLIIAVSVDVFVACVACGSEQIEGDCLRGAEVFHCLRHVEAGFFCDAEEMVDCRFCGENDSGVLRERYFLLSEFF